MIRLQRPQQPTKYGLNLLGRACAAGLIPDIFTAERHPFDNVFLETGAALVESIGAVADGVDPHDHHGGTP